MGFAPYIWRKVVLVVRNSKKVGHHLLERSYFAWIEKMIDRWHERLFEIYANRYKEHHRLEQLETRLSCAIEDLNACCQALCEAMYIRKAQDPRRQSEQCLADRYGAYPISVEKYTRQTCGSLVGRLAHSRKNISSARGDECQMDKLDVGCYQQEIGPAHLMWPNEALALENIDLKNRLRHSEMAYVELGAKCEKQIQRKRIIIGLLRATIEHRGPHTTG